MKKFSWLLLLFPLGAFAQDEPALRLLIPAYFYPHSDSTEWQAIIDAADRVDIVVIVNPGNGLQDELSEGDIENFDEMMNRLHGAGIKMIGYISSDYACSDMADMKGWIDTYFNDYPYITGIFVDETENELISDDTDPHCAKTGTGYDFGAYYSEVSDYIRGHARFDMIVHNPGTDAPEEYLDMADVIVSFESRGERWEADETDDVQLDGKYPASRFASLVYDTGTLDADALDAWLTLAVERNYGYVQFTDDPAWQALPSYWDDFLVAVECANGSATCKDDDGDTGDDGDDDSGNDGNGDDSGEDTDDRDNEGGGSGGGSLGLVALLGLVSFRLAARKKQ